MRLNQVIRVAELGDADSIAAVHVESWRAAYRGLVPQHVLDDISPARQAETWRDILRAQDGQTLVVVGGEDSEVGGFVTVGRSRDEDAASTVGELRKIYLREQWWNTGAGRLLHDVGLDLLRVGFDEATLWVLDGNERAGSFYARRGWRADGAVKSQERGGVALPEIRYRRALEVTDDC